MTGYRRAVQTELNHVIDRLDRVLADQTLTVEQRTQLVEARHIAGIAQYVLWREPRFWKGRQEVHR